MKIRTDFYPTTNRLFWIYEHEGEYYLLDSLPHPILGVLGFYRTIFFKMKAKKITKEEAEKYKNPNYRNNGQIIGVSVGFCVLVGSYLTDKLEKIILLINPEIFLILFIIGVLCAFLYLKIHRKKGGFDKIKFTDSKIKISSIGLGLKSWICCHSYCLIVMLVFVYPYLVFSDLIKNYEYITAYELMNLIGCIFLYIMMSFIPVLPKYTKVSIIELENTRDFRKYNKFFHKKK